MLAASKFNKTWPSIVFSKPLVGCPNLPFFWLPWQRGWAKRHTALPEMQSFRIKRCAFRLVPPDGGLLVGKTWLYLAVTAVQVRNYSDIMGQISEMLPQDALESPHLKVRLDQ